MSKEEFINKMVCEFWFDIISWKGKKWDEHKRSFWLSGMIQAWNILQPNKQIEDKEVMIKMTTWSREEAEQWYSDYLSQIEEDNGRVENRWEILDLEELPDK